MKSWGQALAGIVFVFVCCGGLCAAQGGSSRVVARKMVTAKAEEGVIRVVELENSGGGRAFGCATSGEGEQVIWRLIAKGKPHWNGRGFELKDEQGREFTWFCHVSESNDKGTWVTETIYLGPRDSNQVTVKYGAWTTTLVMPAKRAAAPGGAATKAADSSANIEARFRRAFQLKDAGNCGEALKLFEMNFRQNPDHPTVDYDYGWACFCAAKIGNYQKTLVYYRVMRERFAGRVESRTAEGMLQVRNWDNRLAEVRKILAASANPEAKRVLAEIKKLDF